MKKIAAIFCICILVYSQYARQFSYIGCVIANNLNEVAVKCACETTTADTENKTPILPHSHSKHNHQISPDEWYTSVTLEGPCITICNSRQSYKDLHDPSYKEGTLQAIDHPPQSGFTIS